MMMMDDKKNLADMIVIGIGKENGSDDMNEMQYEAAKEMMDAAKEDDVEAFAYALKAFVEMCGDYED